jgi:hypothetical protein
LKIEKGNLMEEFDTAQNLHDLAVQKKIFLISFLFMLKLGFGKIFFKEKALL